MSEFDFYSPDEVRILYGEIVPAYQAAFAGEPWYEVTKCADEQLRCVGGLSSLVVGAVCDMCDRRPNLPAYELDEMVERFEELAETHPTAWYVEQNAKGLTLGAIAWRATPAIIAEEKYADVPSMGNWMEAILGSDEIMWLDEVFADKKLKPRGNLKNFGNFVIGLAEVLDTDIVAFRTKEPRMLSVVQRDFGDAASIFNSQIGVPDRREFAIIRLSEDF